VTGKRDRRKDEKGAAEAAPFGFLPNCADFSEMLQ
jgi:hypothetical protein